MSATDGVHTGGCCPGSINPTPHVLGVEPTISHLAAQVPAHLRRRTELPQAPSWNPHPRAHFPFVQDIEKGIASQLLHDGAPAHCLRPPPRSQQTQALGPGGRAAYRPFAGCPYSPCSSAWATPSSLGTGWPISFIICPDPRGPSGTFGYSPTGWGTHFPSEPVEDAAQGAELGSCLDLEKPGSQWVETRPAHSNASCALFPECTF